MDRVTPYEKHQDIGRALLARFPELDAALGWRIVDWITLSLTTQPEPLPPLRGPWLVEKEEKAPRRQHLPCSACGADLASGDYIGLVQYGLHGRPGYYRTGVICSEGHCLLAPLENWSA